MKAKLQDTGSCFDIYMTDDTVDYIDNLPMDTKADLMSLINTIKDSGEINNPNKYRPNLKGLDCKLGEFKIGSLRVFTILKDSGKLLLVHYKKRKKSRSLKQKVYQNICKKAENITI